MKRYNVTISVSGYVSCNVLAGGKDEAQKKAEERFWGGWGPTLVKNELYYDKIEIDEIERQPSRSHEKA